MQEKETYKVLLKQASTNKIVEIILVSLKTFRGN
jgi:hypothetical protein